jgi:hypothetical protein
MELENDLKEVFEKHGFIWFHLEWMNEADGQICKCYVVNTKMEL